MTQTPQEQSIIDQMDRMKPMDKWTGDDIAAYVAAERRAIADQAEKERLARIATELGAEQMTDHRSGPWAHPPRKKPRTPPLQAACLCLGCAMFILSVVGYLVGVRS